VKEEGTGKPKKMGRPRGKHW